MQALPLTPTLKHTLTRRARVMLRFIGFCLDSIEQFLQGDGATWCDRVDGVVKLTEIVMILKAYMRAPATFVGLLRVPKPQDNKRVSPSGDQSARSSFYREKQYKDDHSPDSHYFLTLGGKIYAKGMQMIRRDLALRYGPLPDHELPPRKTKSAAFEIMGIEPMPTAHTFTLPPAFKRDHPGPGAGMDMPALEPEDENSDDIPSTEISSCVPNVPPQSGRQKILNSASPLPHDKQWE
ncbi:MAG: hypothetical protein AAFR72_07510 [Pseudomonadota bacterium]